VRVLSDKLVEKADELERTRGELRDSEDRFRILVSNIPAAIYRRSTTADMAIELVSDAIEDLTGYATASLMADDGRGFLGIIHPDDRARVARELAAARSAEGHYGLAYRIVRADGEIAWVGDRGQVVTGVDGEPASEYGTLSDITARKQLEDEHARMETELRMAQKLEAVGQLAAGIAHEINTPIQFVGDGLVFLRESFEDLERLLGVYREAFDALTAGPVYQDIRAQLEESEDAADIAYLRERVPGAFARTLDGVERVASIVRAMKEFAHPQRAQAPADINRALQATLEVTRNEYKYVADVVTDFGELPQVVCNLSDINQVFLNLIVNAAHALHEARTESERLGTITIATRDEGDAAVITVADDGPGIPAEIRTRVFDPFFTTKPVGRGTGQGLAIVRSVVDRHGGSVQFETAPGAGTAFTIRLPFAGAPAAAVE
jgi:PAS domain S-box-containing protein